MDDYLQTFEARGRGYNQAMAFWPCARESERRAVLDRLDRRPQQIIVDAPAGGGCLADGLAARLPGIAGIICVEPSETFAAAIAGRHRTLINPLNDMELPDASVDGVVSLAGLHHFGDPHPIYREWACVLKPGGRLTVGDVGAETGTGTFLNDFVNRHTPGGHDGSLRLNWQLRFASATRQGAS